MSYEKQRSAVGFVPRSLLLQWWPQQLELPFWERNKSSSLRFNLHGSLPSPPLPSPDLTFLFPFPSFTSTASSLLLNYIISEWDVSRFRSAASIPTNPYFRWRPWFQIPRCKKHAVPPSSLRLLFTIIIIILGF